MTATLERDYTILKGAERVVPTNAASELSFALSASEAQQRNERWQRLVDSPLIDWGRDEADLEADGIIPPSREVVAHACKVAWTLYRNNWPAPTKVVLNGEGGIKFERWDGKYYEAVEIHDDKTAEVTSYHNSKLIYKAPLAVDIL